MAETLEGFEKFNVSNWDGYDGAPITPEVLARARLVEQAFGGMGLELNPAPGGDGSIGFEICWPDGRELWIDVGPGKELSAYIPQRAKIPARS